MVSVWQLTKRGPSFSITLPSLGSGGALGNAESLPGFSQASELGMGGAMETSPWGDGVLYHGRKASPYDWRHTCKRKVHLNRWCQALESMGMWAVW